LKTLLRPRWKHHQLSSLRPAVAQTWSSFEGDFT
jgi:hypothetical protein